MSELDDKKSTIDRVSALIGIAGSLLTIWLTYQSYETKVSVDNLQQNLESRRLQLEEEVKRRAAGVEEWKERAERYKWVYSLLPALSDDDAKKSSAALAMIRLSLDRYQADEILAALEYSPSEKVRSSAVQGRLAIEQIESAELRRLVDQMNAESPDVRRSATGRLQRNFADSSVAVGLIMYKLRIDKVGSLTPSGLMNSLYFLSRTERSAWTPDNLKAADEALPHLRQIAVGDQSKPELLRVEAVIARSRH
jgi:hypothetical protein